jgi:hypothetical protein
MLNRRCFQHLSALLLGQGAGHGDPVVVAMIFQINLRAYRYHRNRSVGFLLSENVLAAGT